MYTVADTNVLVADGVLSRAQADHIEAASRQNMVALAIHSILVLGILAATGGLIFWLGTPTSVAVAGALFLVAGYLLLARGSKQFAMFGNSAALIGAGLLLGGAALEMLDKFEDLAGPVLTFGGGALALGLVWLRAKHARLAPFVFGAILAMAVAVHLTGVVAWLTFSEVTGWSIALAQGYGALVLLALGTHLDVRLITALAIVPLAQMLDTGTFYQHAMYAFYSPESTLTIVQMGLVITGALFVASRVSPRYGRHARITALMAFIVANLSALVGSLWGDVVGETLAIGYRPDVGQSWEDWRAAQEAFAQSAITVSADVYSLIWAVSLVVLVVWSAMTNRRGLFNASMTFAGIHAYTQVFESFGDEPIAYALGGLAAIPVAWGVWKANQVLLARDQSA